MLGVSDRSVMGVLLPSRSPAASINALRVKRGGRVKAATLLALRAASGASEALTRLSASTEFAVRSGGMFLSPSCGTRSHQSGLAKAEVAVLVTDDEVIEQRQIEHVGGGTQSQREPRIVRARCGIAARMVVDDHQAGRTRCETSGHEDIRHRDWRA